jgi:hypothetical protein
MSRLLKQHLNTNKQQSRFYGAGVVPRKLAEGDAIDVAAVGTL